MIPKQIILALSLIGTCHIKILMFRSPVFVLQVLQILFLCDHATMLPCDKTISPTKKANCYSQYEKGLTGHSDLFFISLERDGDLVHCLPHYSI